jgi:hypothetical protein
MKFSLIPIHSLGFNGIGEQFDLARLPFQVIEHVNIEDVSGLIPEGAFESWGPLLGQSRLREIKSLRWAFIHRFEPGRGVSLSSEENALQVPKSAELVNLISSCLRLLRPMRQGCLAFAHGDIRDKDGTLDFHGLDLTEMQCGVEVVEAQKLFTLRNRDADELRRLAPEFIRAMRGEFWKFRMAAQFHDLGHFQSYNWKPKFLLWCSALEALFTSHNRDHQGSRVAMSRIKWFIGESTRIYPRGDSLEVIPDCLLTIRDVLEDLYEMRNYVAHGDKLPDEFFTTFPREGINGDVTQCEVLTESASLIIRKSLLKILRDGLLDHFADATPAEAYFGAQGLTNSQLR